MSDVLKELASITPKKRQQIHQSFMGVLWRCELQAMYRYLLGIRRPPRARMHVGQALHKSVQLDLESKINTGVLLPRKDAVEIAAEHYNFRIQNEQIELEVDEKGRSLEDVIGENRDKSANLAGLHWDVVAPDLKPKLVEFPFSIDMDPWLRKRAKQLHSAADQEQDADAAKMLHAEARIMNSASRIGIDLVGTVDITEELPPSQDRPGMIPRVRIRDTKSSGKTPPPNVAHVSEQLDVYSLATLIYDKQLPEELVLDYLYQTPKKKQLKYRAMPTNRNMDDINVILFRFARAVHRWHTAVKTGDFAPANPNDWWCSEKWCGFADRCPAFKKPKLVQVAAAPKEEEE